MSENLNIEIPSNNIIIENEHHKVEFFASGDIEHNGKTIATDIELYNAFRMLIFNE